MAPLSVSSAFFPDRETPRTAIRSRSSTHLEQNTLPSLWKGYNSCLTSKPLLVKSLMD